MVGFTKYKSLLVGMQFICIALLCITLIRKTPPKNSKQSGVLEESKRSPEEPSLQESIILQEIRDKIIPPSTGQLKLKNPEKRYFSQNQQSEYIDKISGELRNGFFVECGAANGEHISNSLFFERERNWTGLLVEASPYGFKQLRKLNRKSYAINTCLSLTNEPSNITFVQSGHLGGIQDSLDTQRLIDDKRKMHSMLMRCYPLHRILQAIGQKHVSYFSLDVEGPELEILKTIPFDEVVIDFLTIEYLVWNDKQATKEKLQNIQDFLLGTGLYELIAIIGKDIYEGEDILADTKGLDVVFKRLDVPMQSKWKD